MAPGRLIESVPRTGDLYRTRARARASFPQWRSAKALAISPLRLLCAADNYTINGVRLPLRSPLRGNTFLIGTHSRREHGTIERKRTSRAREKEKGG